VEIQVNQLIEKYRHKAKSQSEDRVKYNPVYDYELARAVLDTPEYQPKQLVSKLEKQMGVNKLPFHVARQLGRNQLNRPEKRRRWAELVAQAGQELCDFAIGSTETHDYKALHENLKQVVFVEKKMPLLEPKAILFVFYTELPDTVSYKSALQEATKLANFAQSKGLLQDLVDLLAIERGLERKKSVSERLIGDIAGTQALINQSLSREIGPTDRAGNAMSGSEYERVIHENDDLRAAAEVAQHQLEALQEEIEHIRDEAKQETVITFFQEMNSGQHSNLLDQFLKAELLVRGLKKQGTEIPQEIELIPILIRMFTRFVKIQGLRPKAVVGDQKVITLGESDEYEYTGSSWEDPDERKTVEIQSAGWIYGNTLISKPKVKEVTS
jgi:hypothetical protein